jgi:putative hemolysin
MQPFAPLIPLSPMLPPALRQWAQPLEPALWKLLVPGEMNDCLDHVRRGGTAGHFAQRLLEALEIRYKIADSDLVHIPANGPALIVANHPYGIVEGLILAALLECIRQDWKIMVNSMLGSIAELRAHTILVNPFGAPEASAQNRAPLRESVRLLSAGGALVMFPAGEVAHLNWVEHSISEPTWKTTAARLAIRSRSAVVPVFFDGANSLTFQVAGVLHPGLRTFGLAREFHKLRGKTVCLRIGKPISHQVLNGYGGPDHATAYLRSRTLFLGHRSKAASIQATTYLSGTPAQAIDPSGSRQLLSEEVAALPAESELAANHDFTVYLAMASSIPRMLQEIGRSRELTFRAAGEGTGKAVDLDRFDEHYQHLFLWSKADRRLAGAYRLAVTSEVLPRFGTSGLYTNTLFRFKPPFFERLGPAVELGRSFVLPDYQKNYSSLLLLWKGIMRFVASRPESPVLFGAVSISQAYREASRGLIAAYLSDRASHQLARFVAPRARFRDPSRWNPQIRHFAALAADIEDLSVSIADIEDDGKGVPVLIRQYLRMGGRFLGFNVDASFSHSLDALILADLRSAPPALLERCMGRTDAHAFLKRQQVACPDSAQ